MIKVKLMNFVFKLMKFVLKMMKFVLKMIKGMELMNIKKSGLFHMPLV